MMTSKEEVLALGILLLFGCAESNPQPSPFEETDQTSALPDVRADETRVSKDMASGEDVSPQCSGLLQADCEASDECEPYLAWPREVACSAPEPAEPPDFIACGGGGDRICTMVWTWARPDDDLDNWHMFITGCVPDGWQVKEVDGLICNDKPCLDLPEPDCKTTDHCSPIYGSPLKEDCALGEEIYAGCWTGEAVSDGKIVGLPCAGVGSWGHPPEKPGSSYSFSDTCIPDGWILSETNPCE